MKKKARRALKQRQIEIERERERERERNLFLYRRDIIRMTYRRPLRFLV
jgi:hypothetical protein